VHDTSLIVKCDKKLRYQSNLRDKIKQINLKKDFDNQDKRSKETKKTSLEKSLAITATGVLSETK